MKLIKDKQTVIACYKLNQDDPLIEEFYIAASFAKQLPASLEQLLNNAQQINGFKEQFRSIPKEKPPIFIDGLTTFLKQSSNATPGMFKQGFVTATITSSQNKEAAEKLLDTMSTLATAIAEQQYSQYKLMSFEKLATFKNDLIKKLEIYNQFDSTQSPRLFSNLRHYVIEHTTDSNNQYKHQKLIRTGDIRSQLLDETITIQQLADLLKTKNAKNAILFKRRCLGLITPESERLLVTANRDLRIILQEINFRISFTEDKKNPRRKSSSATTSEIGKPCTLRQPGIPIPGQRFDAEGEYYLMQARSPPSHGIN
ncbi:MAG: hypothetical protein KAS93_05065 [Gammaproteobacteria bacterium]|nr:hypothetical protein [Gammaproteobacteria bacterium]